MRGSRTTPDKVAQVVDLKMHNPQMTAVDLEQQTGVPESTAKLILKREFGDISEDAIVKAIIQQDAQNTALGGILITKEFVRRIKDAQQGKKVDLRELAPIMGDATRRRQLLTGGATENIAIRAQTYLPEKEEE